MLIVGISTFELENPIRYGWDREVIIPRNLTYFETAKSTIKDYIRSNELFWGPVEFRAGQELLETTLIEIDTEEEVFDRLKQDNLAIITRKFYNLNLARYLTVCGTSFSIESPQEYMLIRGGKKITNLINK